MEKLLNMPKLLGTHKFQFNGPRNYKPLTKAILENINLDDIKNERGFEKLENFLPYVTGYTVPVDLAGRPSDKFIQFTQLSQMCTEYLVHTRSTINTSLLNLFKKKKEMVKELEETRVCLKESQQKIVELSLELAIEKSHRCIVDAEPVAVAEQCSLCSKTFIDSEELRNHMIRRHAEISFDLRKMKVDESNPSNQTGKNVPTELIDEAEVEINVLRDIICPKLRRLLKMHTVRGIGMISRINSMLNDLVESEFMIEREEAEIVTEIKEDNHIYHEKSKDESNKFEQKLREKSATQDTTDNEVENIGIETHQLPKLADTLIDYGRQSTDQNKPTTPLKSPLKNTTTIDRENKKQKRSKTAGQKSILGNSASLNTLEKIDTETDTFIKENLTESETTSDDINPEQEDFLHKSRPPLTHSQNDQEIVTMKDVSSKTQESTDAVVSKLNSQDSSEIPESFWEDPTGENLCQDQVNISNFDPNEWMKDNKSEASSEMEQLQVSCSHTSKSSESSHTKVSDRSEDEKAVLMRYFEEQNTSEKSCPKETVESSEAAVNSEKNSFWDPIEDYNRLDMTRSYGNLDDLRSMQVDQKGSDEKVHEVHWFTDEPSENEETSNKDTKCESKNSSERLGDFDESYLREVNTKYAGLLRGLRMNPSMRQRTPPASVDIKRALSCMYVPCFQDGEICKITTEAKQKPLVGLQNTQEESNRGKHIKCSNKKGKSRQDDSKSSSTVVHEILEKIRKEMMERGKNTAPRTYSNRSGKNKNSTQENTTSKHDTSTKSPSSDQTEARVPSTESENTLQTNSSDPPGKKTLLVTLPKKHNEVNNRVVVVKYDTFGEDSMEIYPAFIDRESGDIIPEEAARCHDRQSYISHDSSSSMSSITFSKFMAYAGPSNLNKRETENTGQTSDNRGNRNTRRKGKQPHEKKPPRKLCPRLQRKQMRQAAEAFAKQAAAMNSENMLISHSAGNVSNSNFNFICEVPVNSVNDNVCTCPDYKFNAKNSHARLYNLLQKLEEECKNATTPSTNKKEDILNTKKPDPAKDPVKSDRKEKSPEPKQNANKDEEAKKTLPTAHPTASVSATINADDENRLSRAQKRRLKRRMQAERERDLSATEKNIGPEDKELLQKEDQRKEACPSQIPVENTEKENSSPQEACNTTSISASQTEDLKWEMVPQVSGSSELDKISSGDERTLQTQDQQKVAHPPQGHEIKTEKEKSLRSDAQNTTDISSSVLKKQNLKHKLISQVNESPVLPMTSTSGDERPLQTQDQPKVARQPQTGDTKKTENKEPPRSQVINTIQSSFISIQNEDLKPKLIPQANESQVGDMKNISSDGTSLQTQDQRKVTPQLLTEFNKDDKNTTAHAEEQNNSQGTECATQNLSFNITEYRPTTEIGYRVDIYVNEETLKNVRENVDQALNQKKLNQDKNTESNTGARTTPASADKEEHVDPSSEPKIPFYQKPGWLEELIPKDDKKKPTVFTEEEKKERDKFARDFAQAIRDTQLNLTQKYLQPVDKSGEQKPVTTKEKEEIQKKIAHDLVLGLASYGLKPGYRGVPEEYCDISREMVNRFINEVPQKSLKGFSPGVQRHFKQLKQNPHRFTWEYYIHDPHKSEVLAKATLIEGSKKSGDKNDKDEEAKKNMKYAGEEEKEVNNDDEHKDKDKQ